MRESIVLFNSRGLSLLLILTFLVLSAGGGCGYSFVGTGRSLSAGIRSVSLPIFSNSTAEPNIEVTVSNILVNEFIVDGRLAVKKSEDADIVINGSVSTYRIRPVSFDSDDNVDIYRLELGVSVEVVESESGKTLLNKSFKGQWDFNSTPDITITEPQRAEAIKSAAKDAARKIISILIEGF